ncbi:PQQ-binding-like beta-propeller repeat protein [Chloroflexota bacterium]
MDSTPETESWIICPVCQQANPLGRWFCKHCWGAILHSRCLVLTTQEYERWLARSRVKKLISVITVRLASLILLVSAAYLGLYYFTDIVFGPPQSVNSDSSPGEWAMFRHDLGHSGTIDSNGTLPQGTLKWVFSTGGAIHSSPAVVDDTIYVGSRDNKLYALDATTGTKRWEYKTDSWVESSPAIVNGVVYFGSNDGSLYALDAHSGEKLWDFKTKYAIMSSPAVANGIVYFGSDDYHIYALDAVHGEKLWDFDAKGSIKSSPTVANGTVYVGSGSEFCYALNTLDGRRRLRFKSYYSVYSSPAVNDKIVYFGNSSGYLYAVDGNARTWLQEHEIKPFWINLWAQGWPMPAPPPQSGYLWSLKVGRIISSSPVVAGDTLYIGSDNKLIAINLQSHEKRWEFETGGMVRSSPALVDTTIYVGSIDGRLYAVDAATGTKLWDILTGDQITSSPAVADGTIYIGSHDGNLYAIK